MALTDFKDFPRLGRILGIDWGAVRIGAAISTPDWEFIFPQPQIANSKEQSAVFEIVKIIESEKIVGIVLGLPLYSDGTDSGTTKKVREFAELLAEKISIPVVFLEENLTSVEASERITCKDKKAILDSESAVVILENAIAMLKRQI